MCDIENIVQLIEDKKNKWIEVSNQIWDFAETRFKENKSADYLADVLSSEGFTVEKGIANIPTAFVASVGSGKPVVAFLGEYDALSGLSQEGGSTIQSPIEEGGNGHGCGHNLLGTGSIAAAVALKEKMEKEGMTGTVRFYGCPAEEGGSGKTYMVRAGVFDDVDFSLSWHPWSVNKIFTGSSLANYQVYYRFKGKSSHAAASPHLGRSALDAVELMNVGVNYLREHVIQEARMHYAVTNTGGFSPNVVQANAEVLYLIRAPKASQVKEIYKRVCDIAKGAALMTGTEVEIVFDKACSNLIPNTTLEQTMLDVWNEIGTPDYSEDELDYAKRLQKTLGSDDIQDELDNLPDELKDVYQELPLANQIHPYSTDQVNHKLYGSTDVGDVSWVTPTTQLKSASWVLGTPAHTWQVVSIGRTTIGQKGMLQAAKVMAGTALKMLQNPALIEKSKKELTARLGDETYENPIPAHISPGQND